MPSFISSLLALSALSTFAAATPTPAVHGVNITAPRLAFTVKQKPVGSKRKAWPAKSIVATLQKFKKVVPSNVKAAAAAAATQLGSVASNPEAFDQAYLSPVTVGGNTLTLNFDTGSADLWVYSSLMPSSLTSGHDVYDTASGTLMQGSSWQITYGDGSAAGGQVYSDKVVIGGATATKQAVEAATSISASFANDVQSDGLVGLSFSTINTISPVQQTTFFDTIKSSLAQQLFTSRLRKNAAGSYDFGYIDSSKYSGSIAYTPVNPGNGWWEFNAGNYTVGKIRYTTNIGDTIADTGTTLAYLPAKVAANYYAQVKGATLSKKYGGYVFPCSSTLPDFKTNLGGQYLTVPGSYMNYSPVSSTTCFGGIQPNTNIGFSIYGDIFLKAFFVVWDQSQSSPRLGFAQGA